MGEPGKSLQRIERRGGARANAGRKVGSTTQKIRSIAEQAAAEGTTPIQVMLRNMRYYDECAEAITEKLAQAAEMMTPEAIAKGGAEILEVLKLINKMGDFRMKAQECAVDAAPYIHPRLASIDFTPEHDTPSEIINKLTTPKEAASTYGALLDITPRPKQKTNA